MQIPSFLLRYSEINGHYRYVLDTSFLCSGWDRNAFVIAGILDPVRSEKVLMSSKELVISGMWFGTCVGMSDVSLFSNTHIPYSHFFQEKNYFQAPSRGV